MKVVRKLMVILFGILVIWMSFTYAKYKEQIPEANPEEIISTIISEPTITLIPTPTRKPKPTPTPTKIIITESDLWMALTVYRKDQRRSTINLDENLCKYARKRAQELVLTGNPLDGHAGFKRDTESELAFKETGFNALAEDLAYIPTAQNAVQVIEWGWDTSAPHKESLLDNEMSHGCVTGIYPIFVAILGKH